MMGRPQLPDRYRSESYPGDPNDRKGLMAWKKEKAEAVKKLEQRLTQWESEQRKAKVRYSLLKCGNSNWQSWRCFAA